jgi:hypothetical protein
MNKNKRIVGQHSITGDLVHRCSKGWENRCARAKKLKCTCDCGGHNHGAKRIEKVEGSRIGGRAFQTAPGEAGKPGLIVGYQNTRNVYYDGLWLDPAPSIAERNHSPDGFCWGYNGSGPAQLALAIMMFAEVGTEKSKEVYQDFKRDIIAALPTDMNFSIPIKQVDRWYRKWRKDHGK